MKEKYLAKKETKIKGYKALILLFALIAFVVSTFFFLSNFLSNEAVFKSNKTESAGISESNKKANEQFFSASVKLNYGERVKSYNFRGIAGKTTVFDALKSVAKENNIELSYNNNYNWGVFVESIGKVKNGDNGKYWQYYVNDVLGDVAADKKILKEGDEVEWKFEEVPLGN